MKKQARNSLLRIAVLYIIGAVVLLCPASPLLSSSEENSYAIEISGAMEHSSAASNADSSEAHPEADNHSLALLYSLDLLAMLVLTAFLIIAIFLRKRLKSLRGAYVTKLNYYLSRHRLLIKPKFERIFLRWLNRLGGTLALSL